MISALANAGDDFLSVCPKQDDIWLSSVAMARGIAIRQAYRHPRLVPTLPSSQEQSLQHQNITGNYDALIRAAKHFNIELGII